jgi:spore coat protein U-like protein
MQNLVRSINVSLNKWRAVPGLAAIIATGLCAGSVQAQAGTATGSLGVTITITSGCTISTSATLAFGSVAGSTLATTDATANTTLSVTCTLSSPYAVGMGYGANALATQRRMAGAGSTYLNYALYQSTGTTQPWTTATSSAACTTTGACVIGTGTGTATSYTVYGDVPAGQAVAAGAFSDTVTMTVYY